MLRARFRIQRSTCSGIAERLGIAFQITNILRDVPKDYDMGRVYLPQRRSRAVRLRFRRRNSGRANAERKVRSSWSKFEAERAWQFYPEGWPLLDLGRGGQSRGALGAWPASTPAFSRRSSSATMMFWLRRRRGFLRLKKSGYWRERGSAGGTEYMSYECVNVIGGGLAGLSAAVALADSGVRVRLFEKRPYLGGRATSYLLPDGSHVDNCQHVTLGCCTNLADFYRRVGFGRQIRYYDQLYFADAARAVAYSIAPSVLAPPFHMALSFLRFSALTWRIKSRHRQRHAGHRARRRTSAGRRRHNPCSIGCIA